MRRGGLIVSEEQQEANKQLYEAIGENVITYASVDSHLIAFISGFSGIGFMAGFLIERTTALAGKLDAAENLMTYKIKTSAPNTPKDAATIDDKLRNSFRKFAKRFRDLSKVRNVVAHGCVITEPDGRSYIGYSPMMPKSYVAEIYGDGPARLGLDEIRKNTEACRDLLRLFRLLLEIVHSDDYRRGNRKELEAKYGPLDQLTVHGHRKADHRKAGRNRR